MNSIPEPLANAFSLLCSVQNSLDPDRTAFPTKKANSNSGHATRMVIPSDQPEQGTSLVSHNHHLQEKVCNSRRMNTYEKKGEGWVGKFWLKLQTAGQDDQRESGVQFALRTRLRRIPHVPQNEHLQKMPGGGNP